MDPISATDFLQSVAACSAAGRLIYLGLGRQFPALFSYAVYIAVLTFAYGVMDRHSKLYFWTYVLIGPLENIFSFLVVRELVALIFKNYPGIRTVGRWAMYAAIALATGTSLALTGFFWHSGPHRVRWGIYNLEVSQRSIVFTLAFVILAILFALSKYPLHLGANTYVSTICFSALFLSETVRLLLDSLAPHFYNHLVDGVEAVFTAGCFASLALLLQPKSAPVARVAFATPNEEHLLHQLDSLNQLMSRAAKR